MRRAALSAPLLACALLSVAAGPASPAPSPGALTDPVACQGWPDQSYALYLPKSYSPERKWPVLYVFDARGRGELAAKRFAPGAESRGYIVASSNDSASDGPPEPNARALHALWADTHARFAIDDRRVYLAGYSGTARFACFAATVAPGAVAGVIACSGGFHKPPVAKPPFLFFGTTGVRDFNYRELRDLDGTLDRLGAVHRITEFEGGHEWAPVGLCREALEWMDLQAMKTRTLALDRRDVRQLWEAGRERARQLLREGRPDRAIEADRALAAAFSGLTDVSEATAEAARLAGSESARRLEREEARLAAEERRYRKGLGSVWVEIRSPGEALPLARLLRRLDVAALQRRAAGGSGSLDAQAAGRMLSEVFAQTSFYLPRGFLEAKNPGRAALCLSIAARIRPEDPDVWYELASAQACAGSRREAIESLEESVRRGFTRADLLERNEAFAAIRDDPSFRAIVERLSGSPSPPG